MCIRFASSSRAWARRWNGRFDFSFFLSDPYCLFAFDGASCLFGISLSYCNAIALARVYCYICLTSFALDLIPFRGLENCRALGCTLATMFKISLNRTCTNTLHSFLNSSQSKTTLRVIAEKDISKLSSTPSRLESPHMSLLS
jgi:hypothetical protein